MARINIFDYDDEQDGGRHLAGHFDPDKCEQYDELTRYDGNNHVSVHTGSQWEHETLYRTPGGRWVLEHRSAWQGAQTTYRFLDDGQAQEWLLIAEEDEVVEKYFGQIPDERGPGRPGIDGSTFLVKFPADLLAGVDAAAKDAGVSRAEWLRRAAAHQLTADQPYQIQVRGADNTWGGDRRFTDLTEALETRDELVAEIPASQKLWKDYRVVDRSGRILEYQQA